jgi:hypothetical protein
VTDALHVQSFGSTDTSVVSPASRSTTTLVQALDASRGPVGLEARDLAQRRMAHAVEVDHSPVGNSDAGPKTRFRPGPLVMSAVLNLAFRLGLTEVGVHGPTAAVVALLGSATIVVVGVLLAARRGPDRSSLD